MTHQVIWINGPFGVGKTSIATELARRIPALTFDPEMIGAILWRLLPESLLKDDYQDVPLWRHLTREAVVSMHGSYGTNVIVPMTLVVPGYFDEIVGGLRRAGIPVRHYSLIATRSTIEARLSGRPDTTDWTWRQVDRCLAALQDPRFERAVDTDRRPIADIASEIESDVARPSNVKGKAIIFHGTGATPDVLWLPWLRKRLIERGYAVEAPHYPDLNVEPIATFLPKVLANHSFDEQTVLVGHSGGAALLLALLEHLNTRVAQAILVAGYCTPPNTRDEPVLQESYDWDAIKAHAADLYFINSPDDPYGCDDTQGGAMFAHLGGTQIIRNEGHFGDHDQPYDTFDLLDKLIA